MDLDSSSIVSGPASADLPATRRAAAATPGAPAAPDDAALMLRYRDGDVRAFETLYAKHKGGVYRYLKRMCRNDEAANDLFQEVWSKVIASRERYEVRAQFNTFLYRIAHNCTIDYYRKTGRAQPAAQSIDELAEELPDVAQILPDQALSETQLRADFRRALDALPAEQRDVFVLYEESGLSLEDIGRITGVAMETAKSRLRYALQKLRATLAEHRAVHTRAAT
jgi:RNA polymerase sigma-70 factor, ECF subfamily